MKRKILIVCNDHIGKTMAGPGIRAWELAHALERHGHEVAVLARHLSRDISSSKIKFLGTTSFLNLYVWIRRSDFVIQPGRPISILLSVLFRKKILFDQYDPVIFEFLEKKAGSFYERLRKRAFLLLWSIRQRMILRFGESFLVANEKQKDLLIGQMTMLGHMNKLSSITILPFGLQDAKPVKGRSVLRGTKIADSDFLIVWRGGIWGWFDPFTLLRALVKLKAKRSDIKVYFPGVHPPNPDSRRMAVVDRFLEEARSLGLLDSSVFVSSGWTSYEQRADYLLEADAGISLHYDSIETRFAFRTRMLDYLWAGLPVIASQWDSWADIIEQQGLGITVPCEDADALAQAIMRMADDDIMTSSFRERVASTAGEYQWDRLVERLRL